MVFDRGFLIGLGARVVLLIGAAGAFATALATPGLGAARLLAGLFAAAATCGLWAHVRRTNREVARFVEAIGFGDLSQGFGGRGGSGFDRLGAALDGAMRRLRSERASLAEEARFATALVEEMPTALLIVDDEGRVELANKAARRMFARAGGARIEDYARFGAGFAVLLAQPPFAQARMAELIVDDVPQRALLRSADVVRQGRRQRIVSVQPIQSELDAVAIAAQADLVRVLTHEIMNSMTPVTSLAQTVATLMAAIDRGDDPDIAEARLATETLARRAQGIMHFVETYRAFSRAPEVRARRFDARPWAEQLVRLAETGAGVAVTLEVAAPRLQLEADPDLMAQVVINLVKNGAEAARGHSAAPWVRLSLAPAGTGGRVRITVADNGPGVPAGVRDDLFLPFFTTKPEGTGVGLSLARQIVMAHGGTIALAPAEGAGATFEIVI